MDSPGPGARPIGWTELIAGTTALLFGAAAAWGLLGSLAGASRATAPPGSGAASVAQVYSAGSCLSLPTLGGMRLGTARAYPEVAIRLDPAPLETVPAVSAAEAYSRAADNAPGCQTQQLLAYYTAANPPADHVLAWVLVASVPCAARTCLTVSPVDATTGRVLQVSTFTQAAHP